MEYSRSPRFFEAMVVGSHGTSYTILLHASAGYASIGHTLASLKATEAAMGITISEQDLKLRKLALHGENLQSHIFIWVFWSARPHGSRISHSSASQICRSKDRFAPAQTCKRNVKSALRKNNPSSKANPWRILQNSHNKESEDLRKKLQNSIPDLQAVAEFLRV